MKNLFQPWKTHLRFTVVVVMLFNSCSYPPPPLLEKPISTMALPDWAYGERQRLSPILVKGEITAVSCSGIQCTLTMKILEVLRNQSPRDIAPGYSVSISFVGNIPSECHPPDPCLPPPIGEPIISVDIPKIDDQRYAWLRPVNGDSDAYELMAGEYGFGPNLEGLK